MDAALSQVLAAAPCALPYAEFPKRDIVLYGGGRLGKMAFHLLKKAGVSVAAIIDQNAPRLAGVFPVPVLTLEDAAKKFDHKRFIFDCVFKTDFQLAESVLKPLGFHNIYTIYDLLYSIPSLHFANGWQSGALSDADKAGIAAVYENLADDASRAVYLDNLAWRISRAAPRQRGFLISEDDKYFNAITRYAPMKDTHFLDVGAFDLFFTLQALDAGCNTYPPARVLALEPDPESYAVCERVYAALSAEKRGKVTLSRLAVSGKAGRMQILSGHDLSSKLVRADNLSGRETLTECETTTLDALASDLPAVGYVKLHVEGEELPALKGGVQCFAKHRPVVALNCSHNRDGLWEISDFLMRHTEDYRYYFRSHAHYGEGLTFYAAPHEKR